MREVIYRQAGRGLEEVLSGPRELNIDSPRKQQRSIKKH